MREEDFDQLIAQAHSAKCRPTLLVQQTELSIEFDKFAANLRRMRP